MVLLSGGYFHLDQKSLDGGRVFPLLCDLWEAECEVNSNKVKLPKVGSNVIVLVPLRARPNKGENFPELVMVEVLAPQLKISQFVAKNQQYFCMRNLKLFVHLVGAGYLHPNRNLQLGARNQQNFPIRNLKFVAGFAGAEISNLWVVLVPSWVLGPQPKMSTCRKKLTKLSPKKSHA